MFPYCCLLITCFFFILCSVFKVHFVEANAVHSVSAHTFGSVENSISLCCFSSPIKTRFAGLLIGLSLKAHWNPRLETSINLQEKVLFSSWSAKNAVPSKLNNEKFHKWNFWFDFVKSPFLRPIFTERPELLTIGCYDCFSHYTRHFVPRVIQPMSP